MSLPISRVRLVVAVLAALCAGAWADAGDPADIEKQIDAKTKAVYIESLANPGGTFTDIAAIAELAHAAGALAGLACTLAALALRRRPPRHRE